MLAKYKPEFCKIAADVLANGESLAAVCAELDISRTTLYFWRDNNPEFKDSIDRGLQRAQRIWEAMGRNGVEGIYEKFGSSAYIFTMKNRFREDYAEEKETKSVSDTLVEKLIDKLVE